MAIDHESTSKVSCIRVLLTVFPTKNKHGNGLLQAFTLRQVLLFTELRIANVGQNSPSILVPKVIKVICKKSLL